MVSISRNYPRLLRLLKTVEQRINLFDWDPKRIPSKLKRMRRGRVQQVHQVTPRKWVKRSCQPEGNFNPGFHPSLMLVVMIYYIYFFLFEIKALREISLSQRKNSEKLGRNRTLLGFVIFTDKCMSRCLNTMCCFCGVSSKNLIDTGEESQYGTID